MFGDWVLNRRSVRTGGFVALCVNLVVVVNFFLSYLQTTRTHRVYVLGTRTLPVAEANFTLGNSLASSYFQPWIQRDFNPWRSSGISTVCFCFNTSSPACTTVCFHATQASITCHVNCVLQEMIDSYALSGKWHECLGEVLRFQIINGSLWIDHLSERHAGWYPARLGPGQNYTALYTTLPVRLCHDRLHHHTSY